jgi:hypothetical protein
LLNYKKIYCIRGRFLKDRPKSPNRNRNAAN